MDRFLALKTLVSVVDEGGFAAAAKALHLSPPTVTRLIASLETAVKTKLIERSTRSMALTEAGAAYVAEVRGVLADLQTAEERLRGRGHPAFQNIRVAAPSSLGFILAPVFARFLESQPDAAGRLDLLDRSVDAANEGYDLVVSLEKPGTAAEPLIRLEAALVASPAYCARHGRPRAPDELGRHQGLLKLGEESWHLRNEDTVSLKPRAASNRFEILRELCLADLGMAALPLFLVRRNIGEGSLVLILDGFEPKPYELAVTSPIGRPLSEGGRAFSKHLEFELMRRPP
jgi:DNA-binding transcriptional LysR family regulator